MTEEQVTKRILAWLIEKNWKIIAYDFPQSGTGKYLHPNKDLRKNNTKNNKAFIPDIVAVKENIALFFENKNRFYLDDFKKIQDIKSNNIYSEDIDKLLNKYTINSILYGIGGINNESFIDNANKYKSYVDFIVLVGESIELLNPSFEF